MLRLHWYEKRAQDVHRFVDKDHHYNEAESDLFIHPTGCNPYWLYTIIMIKFKNQNEIET